MDTPPWYYRWVYRMPGLHQMRKTTLEFCGIKPLKTLTFGPVLAPSRNSVKPGSSKSRQSPAVDRPRSGRAPALPSRASLL